MTTIIVIVVVALVFFVTVCVVTFMVWKRETEMRTDSIRAIEENLEKLEQKLSPDDADLRRQIGDIKDYYHRETDLRRRKSETRKSSDPFAWIREDGCEVSEHAYEHKDDVVYEKNISEEEMKETQPELSPQPELPSSGEQNLIEERYEKPQETANFEEPEYEEPEYAEINLDFDISDFDENYFDEKDYRFGQTDNSSKKTEHDVGRSGKKYTAQELETLIKE